MNSKQRERLKPYLLLTPATIFFVIFIIIPMVYTLYLSFFDWNMIKPVKEFVGFENYIKIFTDKNMMKVFGNTIGYLVILSVSNFIVPYIFAFICKYVLKKFQNFYKITIFLPAFISLVVASTLFMWILNPMTGPVAALCNMVGLSMPVWSKSQSLAIVVISLITTWGSFGYSFITLFAAVGSVPVEVIESARLDRVPLHKIALDIVFPMSSASGYYVFIMMLVQGLDKVFAPIDVITKGGPDYGTSNLIYESYSRAFVIFETGESATISILTMVFFGLLIWVLNQTIGKKVYYEN